MPKKQYWTVPRMWEDGECWIIGGGPSVPRMFGVPEDVIADVQSQKVPFSVYSDYLKPLHDRHVIGTNIAYRLGGWVSVLYFSDKAFFLANRYHLPEFRNLKITDTGHLPTRYLNEWKYVKRLRRDNEAGLSQNPEVIKWNHNAGGGAINLAYLLGVKRILLLGFDMNRDKGNRSHWHSGEVNYRTPTTDFTFKKFLKYFPFIARDAKKAGIEILNVNYNSSLNIFPKVKLEDVL